MKLKYEKADIEIIRFLTEDVITASGDPDPDPDYVSSENETTIIDPFA